jgi:hypothetical protein
MKKTYYRVSHHGDPELSKLATDTLDPHFYTHTNHAAARLQYLRETYPGFLFSVIECLGWQDADGHYHFERKTI